MGGGKSLVVLNEGMVCTQCSTHVRPGRMTRCSPASRPKTADACWKQWEPLARSLKTRSYPLDQRRAGRHTPAAARTPLNTGDIQSRTTNPHAALSWSGILRNRLIECLDVEHQADSHPVSFLETFVPAHHGLHRHNVPSILGEQRCFPDCAFDLSRDRDHTPAIAHHRGCLSKLEALLGRYRDEVPGCRALPEPDLTGEFEFHRSRRKRKNDLRADWSEKSNTSPLCRSSAVDAIESGCSRCGSIWHPAGGKLE